MFWQERYDLLPEIEDTLRTERLGTMETVLIEYLNADELYEFVQWANDLPGHAVADFPQYVIVKVLHFQLLPNQHGKYDGVVLVEIERSRLS